MKTLIQMAPGLGALLSSIALIGSAEASAPAGPTSVQVPEQFPGRSSGTAGSEQSGTQVPEQFFSIPGSGAGGAPGSEQSIVVPTGSEQSLSDAPRGDELNLKEVHLGEKSVLVLPHYKSVRIQKLIAKDGARIRMLSVNSGGDGGGQGGDGGNSRFFIQSISGHLLIEARGGDGAAGQKGRDGRQGLDGPDGRRGRTLFFGLIYLTNGEDGHSGEPGEDGEDGGDGGDGGAGGRITVYYQTKIDFANIVVDVNGGASGSAGQPGLGGLGGNGGQGGKGIKRGAQGPLGISGRSGTPGRPGRPGRPGHGSVYQLERELFECLSRLDLRQEVESLQDEDYEECRSLKDSAGDSPQLFSATHGFAVVDQDEEGSIFLDADGSNGEDAIAAKVPGTSPADASAGANGGHLTVVLKEIPKQAFIFARGGGGGGGAKGANGSKGIDGFDGRDGNLFHKAQGGTDGTDGGHGGNGSSGGSGGDGGRVRIVYLTSAGSYHSPNWRGAFEVDVSGGRGGTPGAEGLGGRGGRGGKGGKTWIKQTKLPDGLDGKNGLDGRKGREGLGGESGEVEYMEADSFASWITDDFREQSETTFRR